MNKKRYEEPTQDNVKIGDFLYDEINNHIVDLPIIEIKTNSVIAENKEIRCNHPYLQAIIRSDGRLLVGRNANSNLIKLIEENNKR